MPTELRSYIFHNCYTQHPLFESDDEDAFDTICGGAASPPVVEDEHFEDGYRIEFLPPSKPTHVSLPYIPTKAPPIKYESVRFSPEGTTISSEFGYARQLTTTVDPSDITPGDINTLDLNYPMNNQRPQFIIMILCEGEFDLSTSPVFSEIAQILKYSISSILASRDPNTTPEDVIVAKCQDLRFCRLSSERFVILLGIHHLSRYTDADGNIASLVSDFPSRDRTALYNFEDAARHVDFKAGRMSEVLKYYSPNVWDYSQGNMLSYTNISDIQYVPLGFVRNLYPDKLPLTPKYTEVLFYGRLNNYRSAVIELLRSQNILVRHLNAGREGVWHDELREEIRSSKIVLSLRYFTRGSGDEIASTEVRACEPVLYVPVANSDAISNTDNVTAYATRYAQRSGNSLDSIILSLRGCPSLANLAVLPKS